MSLQTLLALVAFAFVTSFTPGPNNIMLTASGVNFGFGRSIPHMSGVAVGFLVLLAAAGCGLGSLFIAAPQLQIILKVAGALYMLWLAWKVANAGRSDVPADERVRPLTFLQAAAFQWVNPKAVLIALGAVALYIRPEHAAGDLAILVAVFAASTVLSVVAWTGGGVALRGLLGDARRARIFNIVMALLLVASIVPMVL
jgi:threonine/homoserine/homoserine lactone efflux protein